MAEHFVETPVRSFFRDLFGTYGWVVVLVVGVIGALFLQVKDIGERTSKVEVRLDQLSEKIEGNTKLIIEKLEGQNQKIEIISKNQDEILTYLRKAFRNETI